MVDVQVEEIPEGEDPSVLFEFEKHGITASLKVTLHFEGDWTNLYDDIDETEEDARDAVAGDLFKLVVGALGT